MISPQYASGFFDGEGCISITYTRLRGRKSNVEIPIMGLRMVVLISNTNVEVLELFRAKYGGYIHRSNSRKPGHHKELYTLRWNKTEEQIKLLMDVYPFSIVKKEAINIALKFISTKQKPGHRPSQEEWDIRLECLEKMKELNKRGLGAGHKVTPPESPPQGFNPLFR